jgi:hypothetical protein
MIVSQIGDVIIVNSNKAPIIGYLSSLGILWKEYNK